MAIKMKIPLCPECGKAAVLKKRKIFTGNNADNEWVWVCTDYPECDMYVGCHPGTFMTLGTLANDRLRALRWRVHKSIDILWKSGKMNRDEVYEELAIILDIEPSKAHVGKMTKEQCEKVIDCFDKRKAWKVPKII